MARELIQARADEDTVESLEEFTDEMGLSRSEAVRRSIRHYLSINGYDFPEADGGMLSEIEDLESHLTNEMGRLETNQEERLTEIKTELVTRKSDEVPRWMSYTQLVLLAITLVLIVVQVAL